MPDYSADVCQSACLGAFDISVAHERDCVAVNLYDSVQYVMAGAYLCEYGISYVVSWYSFEQYFVALVFQKRAHTPASYYDCGGVSLADSFLDSSEEYVVGYLLALAMVADSVAVMIVCTQRGEKQSE